MARFLPWSATAASLGAAVAEAETREVEVEVEASSRVPTRYSSSMAQALLEWIDCVCG